jgi:outer membrane lipoprotein-sorting protein
MRRREFLAAAVVAAAAGPTAALAAPLAPDDQALVERAAAYLDGLNEARGRFVQTDPRGQTSEGELYLDRPGKARFEYQNPPTMLVIADGHTVMVYDRRLKTRNRYPLGSTPLALFLQKHVRLDKIDITDVDRFEGGFSITAKGGAHGVHGQITLTFSDNPVALRQWSIIDARGGRTTVRISDLQPTRGLDPDLFVQRDPLVPG